MEKIKRRKILKGGIAALKNRYVTLSKDEQFEVRSKVTGRIVTVVGLNYKWNEIKEYKIKGEGYFDVNRFEPAKYEISADEFFKIKAELDLLKKQYNKIYISKKAIKNKIADLKLELIYEEESCLNLDSSEEHYKIEVLEELLEENK
jgi:hypothetical protein